MKLEILKDVLKERRINANLSQQELANRINISQVGYSKIERGNKNPSLKTYTKLAAVLGFDMNILKESVREELR